MRILHLTPLVLAAACADAALPLSGGPLASGSGGALFVDATGTHLPPTGGSSMDAQAFDADGDGDLDILIAKEFQPNVLLLNDGTGRYAVSSGRIPDTAFDSEDVAVGDFDRDGDLDAVVAAEDDRSSEYYVNDGSGTFADGGTRLPRRDTSNSVVAADVDGDGDLDLIFGNAGKNFLFLNGGGHFTDHSHLRLPVLEDATQDVEVGDVDGDGDLDIVFGNVGANRLLLNDGRGFFTEAEPGRLPLRAAVEETREAELVDLDGDGDLDLYFANVAFVSGADPQDRILVNDGRGWFTDETAGRLGRFPSMTVDAEFVDVDRDGNLDIVTAHFRDNKPFRVHLNDGAGAFSESTGRVLPPGLTGHGVDVEVADFDGDGLPDLYLSNYVSGADRLLLARP